MATISYTETAEKLLGIVSTTNERELIYDLLRIFSGVTETSIQRIKNGKGNFAKDDCSVVAEFAKKPKQYVAYRFANKGAELTPMLEGLIKDEKVLKKSPRLYIVSDGVQVLAYDPKELERYENSVALLHKDFDFFMPLSGVERIANVEENEADVKAAYEMARLYDDIRRYNDLSEDTDIHALNIFLTRILFCFFAEDTGIFEKSLFTNAVRSHTLNDGSDLGEFIEAAFDMMNVESPILRSQAEKRISQFPYVNGGLFQKHYAIPQLSRRTRDIILKCGDFNWAEINPDIFGSMIQAVVRPGERAILGQHYTSVPNIMKLIRPLFLDELYEEYAKSQTNAKALRALLARMSAIKIFDPACGSGNFLIIAYKELRKLEVQIWERILEIEPDKGILPMSQIALNQFYGIECDEFAQETAILALWLAEHQVNQVFSERFKVHTNPLPLRESGHITLANACRVDWQEVCPCKAKDEVCILGNPPYYGARLQDDNQKEDMQFVFNKKTQHNNLDYISIWFYKASEYVAQNKLSAAAFVTTNSICQGEQVQPLWLPIFKLGVEIFFCYESFKWRNNAKHNAGVTCTIIGLRCKSKQPRYIYRDLIVEKTNNINAYLVNSSNVFIEKKRDSISHFPKISFGSMPNDGQALLLTESEANCFIENDSNSQQFIKRILGSEEFINNQRRYCLWIDDCKLNEAYAIEDIKNRIESCRQHRQESTRQATQKLALCPHRFGEVRYKESTSIIVPAHSSENREYIPLDFLGNESIISNAALAIYDAPMWLFAVLTSRMHNVWVKTVGGRLKTDFRYSATLCYNTFPFPKISTAKQKELEERAKEVLLTREEFTELPLGKMYDKGKMPEKLFAAHQRLDDAVEACYRTAPFPSDDERLDYLFKLYDKMTTTPTPQA